MKIRLILILCLIFRIIGTFAQETRSTVEIKSTRYNLTYSVTDPSVPGIVDKIEDIKRTRFRELIGKLAQSISTEDISAIIFNHIEPLRQEELYGARGTIDIIVSNTGKIVYYSLSFVDIKEQLLSIEACQDILYSLNSLPICHWEDESEHLYCRCPFILSPHYEHNGDTPEYFFSVQNNRHSPDRPIYELGTMPNLAFCQRLIPPKAITDIILDGPDTPLLKGTEGKETTDIISGYLREKIPASGKRLFVSLTVRRDGYVESIQIYALENIRIEKPELQSILQEINQKQVFSGWSEEIGKETGTFTLPVPYKKI